jgi:hypothetical protein
MLVCWYQEKISAPGTHKEDGDQIFANDVSEHVGFSETQVAHCTQTDPEGIVDDLQLCVKLVVLDSIRTNLRELISALVSDNP